MRILLSAALLLAAAACTEVQPWAPWAWPQATWALPPGQLTLSNYRFERASVEAIVTPAADCAVVDPAVTATAFDLPFKGSRVIVAAPNADVCWRRQVAGGQWGEWNRAFTGSGKFIDSQL